ncbi:MAG: PadR family transcriptional regulator [Candidatus Eremiobacteraeota bacterium]|nr:PadR family transcriptional regulator [Candidatus Eremiobacteraeota bacterium]
MMFHRAMRHGHGGHGRGGPPWVIDAGFWGGGPGGGRGGRRRRGDVKFLLLETLADGPKHGYEIIRSIEEKRGVRPSAGSVYPTLQMLEDGGFVSSETLDGKRVYAISETGRELLANRSKAAGEGEEFEDETDPRRGAKEAGVKLGMAVMSARGADEATLDKIRAIVNEARKQIYAVLASDEA